LGRRKGWLADGVSAKIAATLQLFDKIVDSSSIATGFIETHDEARLDGVIPGFEHDRNGGCRCLSSLHRR
jgi:hypothetical protein